MPGSSLLSSARGSDVSAKKPLPSGSIKYVLDLARIADGATGLPPPGCSELGDAADMPELHHDLSACRMDGVRHFAPARKLLRRVEASHIGIALPLMRDRRRFRDEQPCRGALCVIGDGQISRHGIRRTVARQRRQDDAVGKVEVTDLNRIEQRSHGNTFHEDGGYSSGPNPPYGVLEALRDLPVCLDLVGSADNAGGEIRPDITHALFPFRPFRLDDMAAMFGQRYGARLIGNDQPIELLPLPSCLPPAGRYEADAATLARAPRPNSTSQLRSAGAASPLSPSLGKSSSATLNASSRCG